MKFGKIVKLILSLGGGVAATAGAIAIFSLALEYVIGLHMRYMGLVFLLPIIGILCLYVYNRYAPQAKAGNLLIKRSAQSTVHIPWMITILAPLCTLLSHLFGASVGREGIAVQIGGGIFENIQYYVLENKMKKLFVLVGIATGFSCMFGTPFAATVFAISFIGWQRVRVAEGAGACVAAYMGNMLINNFTPLSHPHFVVDLPNTLIAMQIIYLVILAIILGLTARSFVSLLHIIKKGYNHVAAEYWRIFFAGSVIIVMTIVFSYYRPFGYYSSLGTNLITTAFTEDVTIFDAMNKLLLTTLSVGGGFFGGEVTPLFAIGATMGASMHVLLGNILTLSLLAALGYVTVFSSATNMPIMGIVMSVELFGYQMLPYACLVIPLAYLLSGKHHIYEDAKIK